MFAALFVFFILTQLFAGSIASAATPKLLETNNWRTGDIEIKYSGVEPDVDVEVWISTWHEDGKFEQIDTFTPDSSSGSQIVQFRENGQTVWYYIKQNGVRSNILKQTPPITAYIINWPDMLADLDKMINDALRDAMTPSPGAVADLQKAVQNLKDASGAGGAGAAGTGIQNAINAGQGGMSSPIVPQSGGDPFHSGGGTQPSSPTTTAPLPGHSGAGLSYADPGSGTATEMTICVPYGQNMQGGLMKACLFTKEQLARMEWLGLVRSILVALIWVVFAIWLVQRFTPQLKA